MYDFEDMSAEQRANASKLFAELLTDRLQGLLIQHKQHQGLDLAKEIERNLDLMDVSDLAAFSDDQKRIVAEAEAAIKKPQ